MSPSTIAVSGASGQLGRGVLDHLLRRGAHVIATTCSPTKLAGSAATVRTADFDDPASLAAGWRGARVLVLVPTDAPGAVRRVQHAAALRAAAEAGVEHVVYPGLLAHGPAPTLADDHLATEELVQASGLSWTLLRNGIYADGLIARALGEGTLSFGGESGRVAWVAREDLAEAAAAVALNPGAHAGAILELTGGQALSLAEVGAQISEATGREIPVNALDTEAFADGLRAAGLPDAAVAAMRGTTRAIEAGELDRVTGELERLLGRPCSG